MTQVKELPESNAQIANVRLGEMDLTGFANNYEKFLHLKKHILKPEIHYGVIPGTQKPTLYKPGAEALTLLFSLSTSIEETQRDIDMQTGYVDFEYKVVITNKNGNRIAEGVGSCNSYEDKYYFTGWTKTEKPAKTEEYELKKARLGANRKDSNGQWMWCQREKKPINELIALKNTIQKMAKKRAYVDAVLTATGGSEFFTQDIEDLEILPEIGLVMDELKQVVKIALNGVKSRAELTKLYKACTTLQKDEGIHNDFVEKSNEFPEVKTKTNG